MNNSTDNAALSDPTSTTVTSDGVVDLVGKLLGCYLSIPVTLLGIIGNLITILVLSQRRKKDTNSIILLSLACCDLYFVLVQFTRKFSCVIEYFDQILASFYSAYVNVFPWVTGRIAFICSVAHITLIGVERYIAVHYPFKVAKLITKRKLYIGLASLYTIISLMSFPAFALFEVQFLHDERLNMSLPKAVYSDLFSKDPNSYVHQWFHTFNLLGWSLIIVGLNGAFVIFLSLSVAFKVLSLSKDRSKLTGAKAQNVDIGATMMCLSISLVCLIHMCPTLAFNAYMYLQPADGSFSIMYFYDIDEFLSAVNSSINFVLYASLSTKFNQGLRRLFLCAPDKPK